jgi:large subunit ribosomal protein LP0
MSKKGGNTKKQQRKNNYFSRLEGLLTSYRKILIVNANNIGSSHLQKVRNSLRGQAVLLMGKNTRVRKCIREHLSKDPSLASLLPHIKGNVGFVFTNEDLAQIRNKLEAVKVYAPAKAGMVAPCDVIIRAGSTGLEPTKTSFFQALQIPTMLVRSVVHINVDVHLIKQGTKVTPSQAVLLQMLNIIPFPYSLDVQTVYDEGSVYPASLLDLNDADILERFKKGVTNLAAFSLQTGVPTVVSVPYALSHGYRDILAVCLACNQFTFPEAAPIKDLLANNANTEALMPSTLSSTNSSSFSSSSSSSSLSSTSDYLSYTSINSEQEELEPDPPLLLFGYKW